MKQIVLPLASRFPAGHLKRGQLTGFPEKVIKGTKIHTFREDPGKWAYNMELKTKTENGKRKRTFFEILY